MNYRRAYIENSKNMYNKDYMMKIGVILQTIWKKQYMNNNENTEQKTSNKHFWKKLLHLNPTYGLYAKNIYKQQK
jgi:hypothetical protein